MPKLINNPNDQVWQTTPQTAQPGQLFRSQNPPSLQGGLQANATPFSVGSQPSRQMPQMNKSQNSMFYKSGSNSPGNNNSPQHQQNLQFSRQAAQASNLSPFQGGGQNFMMQPSQAFGAYPQGQGNYQL